MNDISELKRIHKELGEAIKRAQDVAEKVSVVQNWPSVDDGYYHVDFDGAHTCNSIWKDDEIDRARLSFGNVFRTKEEAQKELDTRLTIAEFRAQPGRVKFAVDEVNWAAEIVIDTNTVDASGWEGTDLGFSSTYFDSHESVQAAIKAVGADRLLAASKWLSMGE